MKIWKIVEVRLKHCWRTYIAMNSFLCVECGNSTLTFF